MGLLKSWRLRVRALKRDTYALYLAARDRRTPWPARVLAAVILAYAFSPIDLIPDFIPVLGYLDDLVLIPLGLALLLKMVPGEVMADARSRADDALSEIDHAASPPRSPSWRSGWAWPRLHASGSGCFSRPITVTPHRRWRDAAIPTAME